MDDISVKAAATKFELSERRVQKLCETNRIDGCKMVSGVWLIPSDSTKPVDERLSDIPDSDEETQEEYLARRRREGSFKEKQSGGAKRGIDRI